MHEYSVVDGARLGRQIRDHRVRKGMTQRQLADLSTVGVRTIRDLESGRTTRPHPITTELLVRTLGLAKGALARPGEAVAGSPPAVPGAGRAGTLAPPHPAGRTIGREGAVGTVCNLLVQNYPLVQLTGLAGVGKTRVAAEVAARLQADPGWRVYWLRNGERPQGDPRGGRASGAAGYRAGAGAGAGAGVAGAGYPGGRAGGGLAGGLSSGLPGGLCVGLPGGLAAAALSGSPVGRPGVIGAGPQGGLSAGRAAGRSAGRRNVADVVLSAHADGRPTLIVLDDLRADQEAADLAAALPADSAVRVLTASRRPSATLGGRVLSLPPLSLTAQPGEPVGTLDNDNSLTFLLEHAQEVTPSFHLTPENFGPMTDLCRRLDGVPQLLEAAAAAFLVFEPGMLLESFVADPVALLVEFAPQWVQDVAETLHGLDSGLAAALWSLADIPGGWSVELAAARLGLPLIPFSRQVQALLEIGFVRPCFAESPTRFQVLESIRGLGLVGAAGSAGTDDRSTVG